MRVIIMPEVHAKVKYWVDNCVGEVSGLGNVVVVGDAFVVVDACLLKQECSATYTEIAPEAVAKAMFEMKDAAGDMNWWWHSHVNMGCFWSKTDEDQIKETADNGYCVATVFNKKGDMLSAYRQKKEVHLPDIFLPKIGTEVKHVPFQTEVDAWKKEIDEKVAKKTYTHKGGSNRWGTGSGARRWDQQTQSWLLIEESPKKGSKTGGAKITKVGKKETKGTKGKDTKKDAVGEVPNDHIDGVPIKFWDTEVIPFNFLPNIYEEYKTENGRYPLLIATLEDYYTKAYPELVEGVGV